jgi:alpha-glucosidase
MQRYAQTWSGDNFTSWETLKYNIKMGLGLALSGVSNTGHDVGGFAGPRPDPELFVRWVQAGILMPRFSIHSWNDDGTANEPWMYPEIVSHVRELIDLRDWFIPYFYLLLWRYRTSYEPVIRPTFYDFPDDPRCYTENDDMMLGPSLLAAPVVEPGAQTRTVYLPRGAAWWDVWSGAYWEGGQPVELPAPWNRPVLLARAGAVIPINVSEPPTSAGDARGFLLFPLLEGRSSGESFEDDGESEAYLDNGFGAWCVGIKNQATALQVSVTRTGQIPDGRDELVLILPASELRPVNLSGVHLVEEYRANGQRRLRVSVAEAPAAC